MTAAPGYAEGVEVLARERSTVGRTLHGEEDRRESG